MANESGRGTITPEMAEKVLAKDYANIVKKVSEGKPLTKAERDLIQAKAESINEETVTVAKDLSELAELLGVSRQTLYAWKKIEGAPKANPNGSHSVISWRQFVRMKGLQAGRTVPDKQEALKARKLLAEVEQREIRTAIMKGEYVPLEQVRLEWTTNVGKARALLEARFLNELPPVLVGKDAVAIREELDRVLLEVYATLHSGGTTTP